MKQKIDFMDRYLREEKEKHRSDRKKDSLSVEGGRVVVIEKDSPLKIFAGMISGTFRFLCLTVLTVLASVGVVALMLDTTRVILTEYFTEILRLIFG